MESRCQTKPNLLTFQASSKSTGRMTYRFLRTATIGMNDILIAQRSTEAYLEDQQLELLTLFLPMTDDLVGKHLTCESITFRGRKKQM
jgi:hypothetical protein